jgi:hypothetical protein
MLRHHLHDRFDGSNERTPLLSTPLSVDVVPDTLYELARDLPPASGEDRNAREWRGCGGGRRFSGDGSTYPMWFLIQSAIDFWGSSP